MEIIENKVAKSGLITINLDELMLEKSIETIDIKEVLYMGLMLKEKEFRDYIKSNDWEQYTDKYVHIICSSDAIVPTWAYMLMSTQLNNRAKLYIFGSKEELINTILLNEINQLPFQDYEGQRIVIKGCGELPIHPNVYVQLTDKLLPLAKSIMYGEPCSTVPIFKKA
ncbi:MAG: DUF2480 family protein [Bacteroidota bacterium]|nr:DUF2480 family protein [Bacteroidota bacterium]